MRSLVRICVVCLTLTVSVWAHPGHGSTDPGSVVHHIAEPVHLLPWLTLAGVFCVAGLALFTRRQDS